jgi:hypothetical protein
MLTTGNRGSFSRFNESTRGKFVRQVSRNIRVDSNVFSACSNAFRVP